MVRIHEDVLDALEARGLLPASRRGEVIGHARGAGCHVEDSIVALGLLDEATLLRALSDHHGCMFLSSKKLRAHRVAPELLEPIGARLARERYLLPVKREPRRLSVALAHPGDAALLAELEQRCGIEVRPLVALPRTIAECRGGVVLLVAGDASEPEFYERAVARVERLWHEYLSTQRETGS